MFKDIKFYQSFTFFTFAVVFAGMFTPILNVEKLGLTSFKIIIGFGMLFFLLLGTLVLEIYKAEINRLISEVEIQRKMLELECRRVDFYKECFEVIQKNTCHTPSDPK